MSYGTHTIRGRPFPLLPSFSDSPLLHIKLLDTRKIFKKSLALIKTIASRHSKPLETPLLLHETIMLHRRGNSASLQSQRVVKLTKLQKIIES